MTAGDSNGNNPDGVTSCSAIGTLKVPSTISKSDPVLCLVASLIPSRQLRVDKPTKPKKGAEPEPELLLRQGSLVVKNDRVEMLMQLAGEGFHYCLDQNPWYLLGGYGMAKTPAVLESIRSYLSSSDDKASTSPETLNKLEREVLDRQSFLVTDTSAPTLADLDLFCRIETNAKPNLANAPNLSRWLDAVRNTVKKIIACGDDRQKTLEVGSLVGTSSSSLLPRVVFYYGDDEIIPPIVEASTGDIGEATPATTTPSTSGGGGDGLTEEQKQAAAEKRAKKKAAKQSKKPQQAAGSSSTDELDATALDVRVGVIRKAWNHEEAEKLYCEEVDVGEPDGPRKIASGLRPFYGLEEMQNRTVLVLCNLKARNLVGFPSHGMVLCASSADHTKVEFVTPPEGAKVGERIHFEGLDATKAPEAESRMAKKKLFEKLAPDLTTDAEGFVQWKDKPAVVSTGRCFAVNRMPNASVS